MAWPLPQSLRSLVGALDADPPLREGFQPYVPPNTPKAPPPLSMEALEQVAKDKALYEYLDRRGLPVPPELPTWNRRTTFEDRGPIIRR